MSIEPAAVDTVYVSLADYIYVGIFPLAVF